jgi:hypothetical protein
MKKALLLSVLVASVALADSFFSVATSTGLSVECSSLTSKSGAELSGAHGYTVSVTADRPDAGTQALLGGGTLKCCYYGAVTSASAGASPTRRWMNCPSTLDITLTNSASLRDYAGGSFETPAAAGRIAYVPQAVTLDGGDTVTTTITVRKGP